MQIRPNAPLPIVYVISDPSDSGTYYVRSVIRNSSTGAIIRVNNLNFVNLVVSSTNTRRFSKTITSPQDSSGVGFFIDVTTTVYTDSSYTTVATNYQEDNVKYLVLEPWTTGLGLGGGGWKAEDKVIEKIDYEKVRLILKEQLLDYMPKPETPQVINLEPIISHLLKISDLVASIPSQVLSKAEIEAHTSSIQNSLSDGIKGLKIPNPEDVDKILSLISNLQFPTTVSLSEYNQGIKDLKQSIYDIKKSISKSGDKASKNEIDKRMTLKVEEGPFKDRANNLLGIKSELDNEHPDNIRAKSLTT